MAAASIRGFCIGDQKTPNIRAIDRIDILGYAVFVSPI